MAVNLRAKAEAALAVTLEGAFALPVILTAPDGTVYDDLAGQVLYDTVTMDPATGADIVTNAPIVVLRRSSLTRVPAAGEIWSVQIPISPVAGAAIVDFILSPGRPPEGGASIGLIRLYLSKAQQS